MALIEWRKMVEIRKRPIQKKIWIDKEEEKIIRENMEIFGALKFSTYARHVLLFPKTPVLKVDTASIDELRIQLVRIGSNINQIAKIANQTKGINPDQIEELRKRVSDLEKNLDENFEVKVREVKKYYGDF